MFSGDDSGDRPWHLDRFSAKLQHQVSTWSRVNPPVSSAGEQGISRQRWCSAVASNPESAALVQSQHRRLLVQVDRRCHSGDGTVQAERPAGMKMAQLGLLSNSRYESVDLVARFKLNARTDSRRKPIFSCSASTLYWRDEGRCWNVYDDSSSWKMAHKRNVAVHSHNVDR
jgi:hypothetical protein